MYIPKGFQDEYGKRNGLFDYALLKLSTKTNLDDFIPISYDF